MASAPYTDRKTVLPNGITVITRAVDPAVYHPRMSLFSVMLEAGSCHAPEGRTHFLEHMMVTDEYRQKWENFGDIRGYETESPGAWTGPYQTTFSHVPYLGSCVLTKDFEPAFRTQLNVLNRPELKTEFLEFERRRILEEHQGMDPHTRRYWNFLNSRLGDFLPNGNLGSEKTIINMTREDLYQTYDQLYVGKNIIIPVVYPKNVPNISHEIIIDIVNEELGQMQPGYPASKMSHEPSCDTDLRLDGSIYSDANQGGAQIRLFGVTQCTDSAGAQNAYHHIYTKAVVEAVRKSSLAYNFYPPELDQWNIGPALMINFNASAKNLRAISEIVIDNIRRIATTDISSEIDLYIRITKNRRQLIYNLSEEAFKSLANGYHLVGKPVDPMSYFAAAEAVTIEQVQEHARRIIHSPIALRADIGTNGDPDGAYIPLVREFAARLRDGIPLPASQTHNNLQDLLARKPAFPTGIPAPRPES
jgi:predicted Zn-dependent peptidase